jgi:hypothetical protein
LPPKYDPDGHSYRLALLEDGERHLVMHQPIVLRCPTRLVHGICDDAAMKRAARSASGSRAATLW